MRASFHYKRFWADCKATRRARGWSQKQVGAEFGVGGSAVSRWEANKHAEEPVKLILSLCYLYDLNPLNYYKVTEEPALHTKKLFADDIQSWPHDFAMGEHFYMPEDETLIDWSKTRQLPGELAEVFHTEIGWIIDPRPSVERS